MDVLIIGGGPGGTATALALARAGRSVTILERSRYERARIGETLPPEIRGPLMELGVWDGFLADGHIESPGIAVAWGRSELYDNDFIVNPHGPGWHIDRRRFDAMLARAAAAAGAEVIDGARPISCASDPESGWHLEAWLDGVPVAWRAAVLVDATGRSASPARRLGGHRIVHDRLVGLVGALPAEAAGPDIDRRTLIEATEQGWWYTAPLPDGRHIAAFMTDADLLPSRRGERWKLWRWQLESASHTKSRLGSSGFAIEPRAVPAGSTRMQYVAGPARLAVGDAAAAFDPLSSQGITWALESGLAAATALDGYLRGHRRALGDYARRVEDEFARFLRVRAESYRREGRWPASPFWRRRRT